MDHVTFFSVAVALASLADFTVGNPGCCLDDQVQYTLGTHGGLQAGGVIHVYDLETTFAYDYKGNRWGVWAKKVFTDGEVFERIYIEDYNARTRSFFSSRLCSVVPMLDFITHMRPFCVPEDAAHVENATAGTGDKKLCFSTYEFDTYQAGNHTTHFKTGLLYNCEFFNEQAWINYLNDSMISSFTFFNKRGLYDDSANVFEHFANKYSYFCPHRDDWENMARDGDRVWMTPEFLHLIMKMQGHDLDAEYDMERGPLVSRVER